MAKINKVQMTLMLWAVLGIIYFPIYLCAWVLHIIARFILGIAYIFMLQGSKGKDVITSVFRFERYGH